MAVSKTPDVGKILVKEAPSTAPYPWYEPGGKIVRISGQRVYFTDGEGKERFTHEYAAICDTQAEADKLLQWSESEKEKYANWMEGISIRAKDLLESLAKGGKSAKVSGTGKAQEDPATPAPRVRRTR